MKQKVIAIILLLFVLAVGDLWADSKGKTIILNRLDVSDAYTPKVLGLFIGIQEYKDPLWHDLNYPKKDVEDMAEFFTNKASLKLDYTMILTEPEETTRDNIFNNKFEEFQMKNSSDKDVVIIYISSHGTLTKEFVTVIKDGKKTQEPRKVPYILTSDTKEGKVADSALHLYKVIEWFEKLRSQRKVLILDMCHSGRYGKSQLSPDQAELIESAKGINYIPIEDSWASIILSACPMGGVSFEDKDLENSVYTHFLLEGMYHGDMNGDGAVSISEAHNYAIDKTRQYTWEYKKYKQIPTTYSRILGKDPIIVFGKPARQGNPTLFSYASANQDVEIYLDGIHKGMLPKGIIVEPGEHEVECTLDGKTIYSEKIYFILGHDYMLPYFQSSGVKKENKFLFILEGSYRDFYRGDVPEKLTPSSTTSGFTIYNYGAISRWLGLSGGFDFGRNHDLNQYAFRLGLKLTTSFRGTYFFAGPDIMFMFFQYNSDTIGNNKVDTEMNFFCPGAEALLAYKLELGLVFALGARVHYLPYNFDSETNNIMTTQGFVAAGYSF